MAAAQESLVPQLPKTFLRGLESDLRGLCADARRRNPEVKEAAERVILLLKEADTDGEQADAADNAAAVFCSACDLSDVNSASGASSAQIKVALRAVSSLHKLLVHRAVYPSRLTNVLQSLESLSNPCLDDNVTLKVLQGLLSILTIRGYAKALNEDEILRAFSLLFSVRTSRLMNPTNAAASAFSAIAPSSTASDVRVIEQTAKAAFRQVTSDLFAAASDAAVRTAVERKAPSSEFIAVSLFPVEVRAAFSLFMDLINATAGDALEWLPSPSSSSRTKPSSLDASLAIEVLDDTLASNIALFAGQPVFSEVLSARLCPVIHRLLKTVTDKNTLRTLLSLVVTLVKNYWRTLEPDTEALLHALSKAATEASAKDRTESNWLSVYSMEALRCIFARGINESNLLLDLVVAFDLREGSGACVGEGVTSACHVMGLWKPGSINGAPHTALTSELKPFMNSIKPTTEFRASIATSFFVKAVEVARDAIRMKKPAVASAILKTGTVESSVKSLRTMTSDLIAEHTKKSRGSGGNSILETYSVLVKGVGNIVMICDEIDLRADRDIAFEALAMICSSVIDKTSESSTEPRLTEAIVSAYETLSDVISHCKESLGRSWLPALRAVERLEIYVRSRSKTLSTTFVEGKTTYDVLSSVIKSVLDLPSSLSWKARQDMITAFVQCSRQAVSQYTRDESPDEAGSSHVDPSLRIFGMEYAEKAFLNAVQSNQPTTESQPASLWQLLSSHLTSVCLDSSSSALRALALKTLTRLSCGIISSAEKNIPHNMVLSPFLDLLASSNIDVCIKSISSMHSLLTTEGEHLTGNSTWYSVLQMLCMAGGSKLPDIHPQHLPNVFEDLDSNHRTPRGADLVSEGFKVVQIVASDFLSLLTEESLLAWVALLRIYCLQFEDVNVALTSVGLVWRTADFLAKNEDRKSTESVLLALFIALKDVSLDERPEVRKCAIKTLMGALSAHVAKISLDVWFDCLEFALFPLLENVLRGGVAGSKEEVVSSKSSSDVPLLMHHSRDTPRKQWNETRVLALGGVADVLRVSLPFMTRNGDMKESLFANEEKNSCWNSLLKATCLAACSRDAEVALAGVSALLDYLNSVGLSAQKVATRTLHSMARSNSADKPIFRQESEESDVLSNEAEMDNRPSNAKRHAGAKEASRLRRTGIEVLWDSIWIAISQIMGCGETLNKSGSVANEFRDLPTLANSRAVMLLTEGLLNTWNELNDVFSVDSSRILTKVLIRLSFSSAENLESEDPEERLRLEKVALAGLEKLVSEGDISCRSSTLSGILEVLNGFANGYSTDSEGHALRAIELVEHMYARNGTSIEMKLGLVQEVIATLSPIILRPLSDEPISNLEGRQNPNELRMYALECLVAVMRSIPTEAYTERFSSLWVPYLQLVEQLLFQELSKSKVNRSVGFKSSKRGNDFETNAVRLTECAMQVLTTVHAQSSTEAKRLLIQLLTRGAEEGVSSGRPKFVRACQKMLFRIADASSTGTGKAFSFSSEAAEYIIQTCDRVLRLFVSDIQRAGRCPLPAKRREEIVFLLSQLISMNRRSHASSRHHFVTLYPRLCECVECRDEAVRILARELLDEAAPSPSNVESAPGLRNDGIRVK